MGLTERQVEARERRKAALHEAGHVVIGRELGLRPVAWIWRNVRPGDGEKTWLGRCMHCPLGGLIDKQRAMLGVAGAVAETCWKNDYCEEAFCCDPDIMSASDWASCDCEPGDPGELVFEAIEAVHGLLAGRLRPELVKEARRLIESSRRPEAVSEWPTHSTTSP